MGIYNYLFLLEALLVIGPILGAGGLGIKLLLAGRKTNKTALRYLGSGLLAGSLLGMAYLYFTGFLALLL